MINRSGLELPTFAEYHSLRAIDTSNWTVMLKEESGSHTQPRYRERRTVIHCRAILFDMDGTLVDSNEVCEAVWREWAHSVRVDPAPILAIHHGRRPEETIQLTYPHLASAETAIWLQQQQIGRTEGLKLIPGADTLVDSLGDTPWAVVTSASRVLAEDRLRAVGLWRGQPLIGADDVAVGKPSPEGYLAAARILGTEPAHCVVFEDAPAGIEAGKQAGMPVVAVMTTHQPIDLATLYQIRNLASLSTESGLEGNLRLVIHSD